MNSKARRKIRRKFKHQVELPMLDHSQWEQRWQTLTDRHKWLEKNVGNRNVTWMMDTYYKTYSFKDARTATWFKMRWL